MCFINLVDFDQLWGHRNDVAGYAGGFAAFDAWLSQFLEKLGEDDTLIITADHGGHGRMHGSEMPEDMTIPMIFLGTGADRIKNLDDANIKDIAPTVATLLGVTPDPEWEGKSLI